PPAGCAPGSGRETLRRRIEGFFPWWSRRKPAQVSHGPTDLSELFFRMMGYKQLRAFFRERSKRLIYGLVRPSRGPSKTRRAKRQPRRGTSQDCTGPQARGFGRADLAGLACQEMAD